MSARGCVKSAKYCSTIEQQEHSYEVCVLGQERNGTFLRRVSHVADLLCGKSRDTGLLCGKSRGDMARGCFLWGLAIKAPHWRVCRMCAGVVEVEGNTT